MSKSVFKCTMILFKFIFGVQQSTKLTVAIFYLSRNIVTILHIST